MPCSCIGRIIRQWCPRSLIYLSSNQSQWSVYRMRTDDLLQQLDGLMKTDERRIKAIFKFQRMRRRLAVVRRISETAAQYGTFSFHHINLSPLPPTFQRIRSILHAGYDSARAWSWKCFVLWSTVKRFHGPRGATLRWRVQWSVTWMCVLPADHRLHHCVAEHGFECEREKNTFNWLQALYVSAAAFLLTAFRVLN